jgi:hypothetical protein
MKSIPVASRSFLTGTGIADAVMRYRLQLAFAETMDVANIPFLSSDGSINRAQICIGCRTDKFVT